MGIEDFVISQIEKMLDTEQYVERFKEHLKDIQIDLERKFNSTYPALKKKLHNIDKEITNIQDALIYTENKSKSLSERLLKKEAEKEILLKEIKKYENIKSQPSKVLLLANEYAKVLKVELV